jgi:BirA family biotin operon repressor/biotin-[acetyl-CoA-carboxylase] ligase
MDETDLERALAAAGLEAPVRFDEVTGSTNATAVEMAERGSPEWTLIAARHQTAGRGRLGRGWADEGDGLLFSLVLRPEVAPSLVGLIPLLAGASMAQAIRLRTGEPVTCKWPNDLLLDEAKVGGVLAESRVQNGAIRYVALGIGVNVGAAPIRGSAGLEGRVDRSELLSSFLVRFSERYVPAHPAFAQGVLSAWRQLASTIGRTVTATTTEGLRVEGRAVDVDEHGGLVVETDEGDVPVSSGQIEHLDT